MSDDTHILNAIEQDPQAAARLLALVYDELRQLAAQKMANERPGHTLDATGLVHEAYLRLVASPLRARQDDPQFDNRGHFFAAAAEAMRRILIQNARRRGRLKRGSDSLRLELLDAPASMQQDPDLLRSLDKLLARLEREDSLAAKTPTNAMCASAQARANAGFPDRNP